MYLLKLGVFSKERNLVDIINSKAKVLLRPRQTITYTYDIKLNITLALSNNINVLHRIETEDTYYSYQSNNGGIIRFVIKKSLNTIDFDRIDMLLNPNLLHEAGIHIYNAPYSF